MTSSPDRHLLQLRPSTISVHAACQRVQKDRNTIIRWCKKYGIGRQMDAGAEWRIDPIALIMVADANREALDAYKSGDMSNPAVMRYVFS